MPDGEGAYARLRLAGLLVAAFLSVLLVAAVGLLTQCLYVQESVGLPILAMLLSPGYVYVLVRLAKTANPRSSATLSTDAAGLGLTIVLIALLMLPRFNDFVPVVQAAWGLAAVSHMAMALVGLRARRRFPKQERPRAWRLLVPSLYVIFAFVLSSPMDRDPKLLNELGAANRVAEINSALARYAAMYGNGYPTTLRSLWPGPVTGCGAAGLLPEEDASGQPPGYQITYIPGAPVGKLNSKCSAGVKAYQILARPVSYGRTGCRCLFSDESGEVHATRHNRPATRADARYP